jgi:hypothetical protein
VPAPHEIKSNQIKMKGYALRVRRQQDSKTLVYRQLSRHSRLMSRHSRLMSRHSRLMSRHSRLASNDRAPWNPKPQTPNSRLASNDRAPWNPKPQTLNSRLASNDRVPWNPTDYSRQSLEPCRTADPSGCPAAAFCVIPYDLSGLIGMPVICGTEHVCSSQTLCPETQNTQH